MVKRIKINGYYYGHIIDNTDIIFKLYKQPVFIYSLIEHKYGLDWRIRDMI